MSRAWAAFRGRSWFEPGHVLSVSGGEAHEITHVVNGEPGDFLDGHDSVRVQPLDGAALVGSPGYRITNENQDQTAN